MQHIVEEDSTQEYGHKVPSHGCRTCKFRNLFPKGPLFLKVKEVVREAQEAFC